MAPRWEYQVWVVGENRVQWVNGRWNGSRPLDTSRQDETLQSCPLVWDFLQRAGEAGWELTGTASSPGNHAAVLYLKRPRP